MTRTRRFAILAAGLTALGLHTTAALGQVGLPEAVVGQNGSLAPADTAAITAYIDTHKAGLGGEPGGIKRARTALMAPLRNRGAVGSVFRVEYGRQLRPVIEPLAASKDREDVAINALHLAGHVGTRDTIGAIVIGLRDERPAVRLAAAFALGNALQIAAQSNVLTIDLRQIRPEALDVLQAALQRASDPHVADGLAIAFDAAVALPEAKFPDVRADAATRLATALGARARAAQDLALAAALFRASSTLQTAISGAGGQTPLPASAAAPIADFAAEVLRMAARLAEPGTLSDPDRATLVTLVKNAENTYVFAQQRAGKPAQRVGLGEMIEGGKDREFVEKARQVVGR